MAKKRVHRPEGSRPISLPAPPEPHAAPGAPARARRSPREWFEDTSRPGLAVMARTPTYLVPSLLAVMLFAGLAIPAPGAGVLLLLIAAFLGWLTAVSWPAVGTGSRVLRVVVDLGMLVLGVLKLLGRI